MNKTATLSVKTREKLGSKYCGRIRQAGGLPAVLYGHGAAPVALTMDWKEAAKRLNAGEKVFTLNVEGGESQVALVKEIQFDYLGDTIIHVDFARVRLDEQVEVHVPIKLTGEAVGLKSAGAVLLHPVSDLTVKCLVTAIPDVIAVDISALDVGHSLHVREITAPEGVTIVTDGDAVVATIHMKQEEVVAEAAAVEGDAAQPEVITAKKPAEGEEGDAAKPGAKGAAPAKGGAPAKGAAPAKDAKGGDKKK